MRTFGLLGFPLTHSFSKGYFDEKFKTENITDARFQLFSFPDVNDMKTVLEQDATMEGFCITIPHKKNIIPFLAQANEVVTAMGACNCVRIKDGLLYGYNTDVEGFEVSFTAQLQPHHTRALILGTGGAAAAVQYVLNKYNIPFRFVSRTPAPGQLTYTDLTAGVMQEYKIIINCTPLGTFPDITSAPEIPYGFITPEHYLYDLVYNPPLTRFLEQGQNQGAVTKNGYDMLTIQAEANWKIWNS